MADASDHDGGHKQEVKYVPKAVISRRENKAVTRRWLMSLDLISLDFTIHSLVLLFSSPLRFRWNRLIHKS